MLLPLLQRQIHSLAPLCTGVRLDDSTAGFPKWKGVSTLENNFWVHRDA
jgi:hypothetical protein